MPDGANMAPMLDPKQKEREQELAHLMLGIGSLFVNYNREAIMQKEANPQNLAPVSQSLSISQFQNMNKEEIVRFVQSSLKDRGMSDFKVELSPKGDEAVLSAPPSQPIMLGGDSLQANLTKIERTALVNKPKDSQEYQAAFTSFISSLSAEFSHVEDAEQMKSLVSSWSKVFDNFVQGNGGEYVTLYDYMTQAPTEYRTMSIQDGAYVASYEVQHHEQEAKVVNVGVSGPETPPETAIKGMPPEEYVHEGTAIKGPPGHEPQAEVVAAKFDEIGTTMATPTVVIAEQKDQAAIDAERESTSEIQAGGNVWDTIREQVKRVAAEDGVELSKKRLENITANIYASKIKGEEVWVEEKDGKRSKKSAVVHAGDKVRIGNDVQKEDDIIRKYMQGDAKEAKTENRGARNEIEDKFFKYIRGDIVAFNWGNTGGHPGEKGAPEVCSTFTDEVYGMMGLTKVHGDIPLNNSQMQAKKLITAAPNIGFEQVQIDANNLDFVKKGAVVQVPSVMVPNAEVKVDKILFQGDGETVFTANGKRYVAQMKYDENANKFSVVVGAAAEWNPLYDLRGKKMAYYRAEPKELAELNDEKSKKYNPEKYKREKEKYEQDLRQFKEVSDAKSKDANLACYSLAAAYPLMRASEGKMDYLAIGGNINLAPNWRHAVFYKYIYKESYDMQIDGGKLDITQNGTIVGELNNLFANIPANAAVSEPKTDENGIVRVNIAWKQDHVRMRYDKEGKRTYQDNVDFSADLIIDRKAGKAYFIEECRHKGGEDSDLQGTQLIPFDIKEKEDGKFNLVLNGIFMFENTTSFDPTRVVQDSPESTIRAHYIFPEQLREGFSPKRGEFGDKAQYFAKNEFEWSRYLMLIYGSGRYNANYGTGQANYTDDNHVISNNLIPKGDFGFTPPQLMAGKEAPKGKEAAKTRNDISIGVERKDEKKYPWSVDYSGAGGN